MALYRPATPVNPDPEPGIQVRVRDDQGGYEPDGIGTLAGWVSRVRPHKMSQTFTRHFDGVLDERTFRMSTFVKIVSRSVFLRSEDNSRETKLKLGIPRECEGVETGAFDEEGNEELRFTWNGLLVDQGELAWLFGLDTFTPYANEPWDPLTEWRDATLYSALTDGLLTTSKLWNSTIIDGYAGSSVLTAEKLEEAIRLIT